MAKGGFLQSEVAYWKSNTLHFQQLQAISTELIISQGGIFTWSDRNSWLLSKQLISRNFMKFLLYYQCYISQMCFEELEDVFRSPPLKLFCVQTLLRAFPQLQLVINFGLPHCIQRAAILKILPCTNRGQRYSQLLYQNSSCKRRTYDLRSYYIAIWIPSTYDGPTTTPLSLCGWSQDLADLGAIVRKVGFLVLELTLFCSPWAYQ